MELINSKEKHLRFINEIKLGLIQSDEDLGLLSELFKSTDEPGFKEKEEKYIRFPYLKQRYDALLDKGKATVINKIDIVINGGNLGNPTYSSSLKPIDWIVSNALAAYCTTQASPSEKSNIINFLTHYYNPYPVYGTKKGFSDAGYKAIPKAVEIGGNGWPYDVIMDFVSESYYEAINYLLKNGGYNPSKSPFDYTLFQLTWKGRFMNQLKDYLKRRRETEDDYSGEHQKGQNKSDNYYFADKEEADDFMSGVDDTGSSEMGFEEPNYGGKGKYGKELKSTEEKIAYLGSKLNKSDLQLFNTWYKWIKSNTGKSKEDVKETIVDSITSGNESSLDILVPEDERFYKFLTRELNIPTTDPKRPYNAAISAMSRMKKKIIDFVKDPEFKEKMGIEHFGKITTLGMLKGTEKSKIRDGAERLQEGKMNELEMLEFISETKQFFVQDFFYNKKMLDRIQNLNKIANDVTLDEAYQVEVQDLDQEILGYLKYITESLFETGNLLNELYKVHENIKFEYPDVSEKIAELIPPVSEEVSKLIQKVNEVKKQIKPVLYNLDESKKKFEDELEEERLTNPDTKDFVKKRENFIGSHIYGEDLGGLGKMYVAYSYGEQFPAYLWYKNKWYHNSDNYVLDDGSINEPTNQHKADMRPSQDTHGMSTHALNSMIRKFKSKNGLGDNVHTDVEPGEKN